jgi:putative transposase
MDIVHWHHAPPHSFEKGKTYLITAGTAQKKLLFDTQQKLDLFCNTTLQLAKKYTLSLQAWAFLANHYHIVASSAKCAEGFRFDVFLKHLHRELAIQLNRFDNTPGRPVMYQYRDTVLTFEKSWLARLHYVHYNPVRHKLVRFASDYPWCSAAWFESTASPAFIKTVYSFKIDHVNVLDDF